jgi:hypothetical protein
MIGWLALVAVLGIPISRRQRMELEEQARAAPQTAVEEEPESELKEQDLDEFDTMW